MLRLLLRLASAQLGAAAVVVSAAASASPSLRVVASAAAVVPLHSMDGVQLAAPPAPPAALAPPAPSVSCYLRGGTNPAACCSAGRTCTPFDTYVLDRRTGSFTRHPHINCSPHSGSQWGTGDLGAYNVTRCEAACVADRRCDAVTVGPAPGGIPPLPPPPPLPAADFEWIRAIERGPPGRRYVLNASTYLIDRQYQLPPRTEIVGAGSDHHAASASASAGVTVIKGVGPAYSSTCGKNAKNRKGLLLGDHTHLLRTMITNMSFRFRNLPPILGHLCHIYWPEQVRDQVAFCRDRHGAVRAQPTQQRFVWRRSHRNSRVRWWKRIRRAAG